MRLFYAGAELRELIDSADWPDTDEFRELLAAFNDAFRDHAHGTRVVDVLNAIPTHSLSSDALSSMFDKLDDAVLSRDVYDTLVNLINHTLHPAPSPQYRSFYSDQRDAAVHVVSPYGRPIGKVELGHVIFGTRSKNIRNSFVCFQDPSSDNPSYVRAGQISDLFLHAHTTEAGQRTIQVIVVVDEYQPLAPEHVSLDPYRRFPLLNTQLFYNHVSAKRVIRSADLVCHFAALVCTQDGIPGSCIVVRALDRVCTSRFFRATFTHTFFRASELPMASVLVIKSIPVFVNYSV